MAGNIARSAYDAYCQARQWQSYEGKPLPQFHQQTPELKAAWELAALAAIRERPSRSFSGWARDGGIYWRKSLSVMNELARHKVLAFALLLAEGALCVLATLCCISCFIRYNEVTMTLALMAIAFSNFSSSVRSFMSK